MRYGTYSTDKLRVLSMLLDSLNVSTPNLGPGTGKVMWFTDNESSEDVGTVNTELSQYQQTRLHYNLPPPPPWDIGEEPPDGSGKHTTLQSRIANPVKRYFLIEDKDKENRPLDWVV